MLWLAGLFFLAVRKIAGKWAGKKAWWLPVALLMLAVFCLMYAPLPFGWGTVAAIDASILRWCFGFVGGLIGVSAPIIAGLLLALVLLFGAHDLIKDHKPDAWARTMIYSAPALALVATGPVALQVGHVTHLISNLGPTVVAHVAG